MSERGEAMGKRQITIHSTLWITSAYNALLAWRGEPNTLNVNGIENVLITLDWCDTGVWFMIYDTPAHKQVVRNAEALLRDALAAARTTAAAGSE